MAENQRRAEGEFPVVGFIKDPSGVAALYVGKQEGKELVYMGKVGTRLVPHGIQPNPQTTRYCGQPEVKSHEASPQIEGDWVEPTFFADVEFRDITSEGLLRQSSFKGASKRNVSPRRTFGYDDEPVRHHGKLNSHRLGLP
jgi:bifunctional non-homologous end joining protein LigD